MKRIDHAVALALALMTGLAAADEGSRRVVPDPSARDGDRPREASADLTPLPFDSLTAARYRQTALELAKAVATDDAAAFRALHTDAGWAQTDDWWQSMLATHKKKYGKVARVVGPIRGSIRMGDTRLGVPRDGAAILVRFERPLGASMSFTLDAAGRIVTSSLWVQHELADASTEGAEVLWATKPKGAK